jgi:hypothetical protein
MSTLGECDGFLHEIELDVRAELTIVESSQPGAGADSEPDVTMLLDVDAERYEVSLRSLLGAVEAVEDASPASPADPGQAALDRYGNDSS